jgi:hypothetical protein
MTRGINHELVRVEISLPCHSKAEHVAALCTVGYLRGQERSPDGIAIRGLGIPAEPIQRYWWSETRATWIIDKMMIITIDYDISVSGLGCLMK